MVDVVRDRKSYSLKQYFHRFEPMTRLKVKTISIDTYLPYIQNTCEYPTRTNGPTKEINNKIKCSKEIPTVLETISILEAGLF